MKSSRPRDETGEGSSDPSVAKLLDFGLAKLVIDVLPFTNMSADPENEYFGDGLAEEIMGCI